MPQWIVHLVGDAGNEASQRGELLALEQHLPLLPELELDVPVVEVLADPAADIGEHREQGVIRLT